MGYINKLKQVIQSCTLNSGSRTLSEDEKDLFESFLQQFIPITYKHIIYRGDYNLMIHYNADINSLDLLSENIFMVGMKSKFFLDKKYIFTPLDVRPNLFEFLFDRINTKVCENSFQNPQTHERVQEFLYNNKDIFTFFKDKNNKDVFLKKIERLTDKQKQKVKDYYFSLLHTIGRSGYNNSYFLSSSLSRNIAKHFSPSNGIILIGWLPYKNFNQRTISYNEINKVDIEIKQMGLPTYSVSLYKEQKEICLKCGMLPHYILGFIVEKDNDKLFVVNPAILENMKNHSPIDEIVKHGLNINQNDFNEFLKRTNYLRAYAFCDGEYFPFTNGTPNLS